MLLLSFLALISEASQVIEIRLKMLASGQATSDEMILMVREKVEAMEFARRTMLEGGDPALVVANYRKIIAQNVRRLTQAPTA